jgi:WS/DGAT/MGAT family acyltransferase
MRAMPNPDRLSGLDASFLAFERDGAHMHVGSVLGFLGPPPTYDEFLAHVEGRLHLVPRYRQRLAFPPYGAGRPQWVDDAHFNARYHVRHSALPDPGGDSELRRLAGRLFSQPLDRAKPLWELWLIEGVDEGFALIAKTHHALVDGISGVDIATVLFDLEADPLPAEPPPRWSPRPEPSRAVLFADALVDRAQGPVDVARALRYAVVHPDRAGAEAGRAVAGLAALAAAGVAGAPASPLNVRIGPHRRFAWTSVELVRL